MDGGTCPDADASKRAPPLIPTTIRRQAKGPCHTLVAHRRSRNKGSSTFITKYLLRRLGRPSAGMQSICSGSLNASPAVTCCQSEHRLARMAQPSASRCMSYNIRAYYAVACRLLSIVLRGRALKVFLSCRSVFRSCSRSADSKRRQNFHMVCHCVGTHERMGYASAVKLEVLWLSAEVRFWMPAVNH